MTKRRCTQILLWTMLFTFFPLYSWAKKVYLNGINITGMTNKTFSNVTVRLDAKGNVYIIGKQYKVVQQNQTAARPATPSPAKRTPTRTAQPATPNFSKNYLLVFQRSMDQGSGYVLKIVINGKKVRDLGLFVRQDIIKLNRYLHKGRNTIVVEAIKKNTSAYGELSLILTTGQLKTGRVLIEKPYLFEYKRKSFEKKSYRHIYPVTIQ